MSEKRKMKATKMEQKTLRRKFLLIFVCIFVSILLVFGAVLGIASAIKKSRSVVSFKGITMDEEVASFFVTQYKYNFMSMLSASGVKNVEDTLGFWNKVSENEKTYGELLTAGAYEYIKQIMATNYIYDRYASLSKSDKAVISTAVEETLTYKAGGNENTFNKAVSEYGFSYSSYKTAVTMLYKATLAQTIVCGSNGENLENGSQSIKEYITVEEYLSRFSHVKLLFIRTDTTFVLDNSGNRIKNSDGSYQLRNLTDEEKEQRQSLISEIRGHISAIGSGEAEMGATMFDYYLQNNDEGDPDMRSNGYYFNENSEYTQVFTSVYEDIVNTSYELQIGEFGEAEVDFGVCFIYKYETSESDLEKSTLEVCFRDFYSDLSGVFFDKLLADFTPHVEFSKKMDNVDVLKLPYNYIYLPAFQ